MAKRHAIIALLLAAFSAYSAEIIPTGRKINWQRSEVGIPGGIPDSSGKTVGAVLALTTSEAALESAWDSCSSNQVLQLTNGVYDFNAAVDLDQNNGVIIRGKGMGVTILRWSGFSGNAGLRFRGNYVESSFDVDADITANNAIGDTVITIGAGVPSWVTAGKIIGIDQLDDTAIASQQSENQRSVDFGGAPRANGQRSIGQLVRVVSKGATTITIEQGCMWPWATAQTAQIFQPGYNPSTLHPVTMVGMEDLTLEYTFNGANDQHPIQTDPMDRCWFKNVEIKNMPSGRAWWTHYLYRCEFKGVWVHGSGNYAGGQGYCLDLNNTSTSCLIHDSGFEDYHVGITTRYGAIGNVIAHNFFRNSSASAAAAQTAAMSSHGCHAAMNLWEGNWTNDKVLCDFTHGSASHNTVFRNVIEGRPWGTGDETAISVEQYNRYWNFVGNILGVNGRHNKFVSHSGSTAAGSTGNIFKIGGTVNINNDYTGADTYSFTTGAQVLIHANYNHTTDSVTLNDPPGQSITESNLVNSYFLSAAPSEFTSGSGGVELDYPLYNPYDSTTFTNKPPSYLRIVLGQTNYFVGSPAVPTPNVAISGRVVTGGKVTIQ